MKAKSIKKTAPSWREIIAEVLMLKNEILQVIEGEG
jgi:hypothetical protein